MGETLTDFILNRLNELGAMRAPMVERLSEIETEMEQLQRAAAAAGIAVPAYYQSAASNQVPEYTRRSVPEKTIKEAVVTVLKDFPVGLTALEILDKINAQLGVNYPRTSLSPQLSRLKADGRIKREGNIWRMANMLSELTNYPRQTDIEDALK